MATPEEDLKSFSKFVRQRVEACENELSLPELFDEWMLENVDAPSHVDDAAAVQAAIDDMKAGDNGREAGESERELRKQLNLPRGE